MNNTTKPNQKRKHKATRYKTKDYHSDVVKKRPKTIPPSPNTLVVSPSQPTITSFLIESQPQEQTTQLKVEDYFKVPTSKNGFNLLSLRRSFHIIKTNVNIVGLIKKNVLNNNIVKWTVQSKLPRHRTRTTNSIRENNATIVPSITNESLCSNNISRDYHRLYVEDYILLNVGNPIKVLIPVKATKKKYKANMFDPKFLICLQQIEAPITQIGSDSNRFYVISCIIKSSPNRNDAISGIDRITLQNGFKGNQNFGCLLEIEDTDVIPLLKWRDVLNGGREGLQVSNNYNDYIKKNIQQI